MAPGRGVTVDVHRDVPARMRDGTVLRADIYRPQAPGRFPVLLCRTPYGKLTPLYAPYAPAIAARGYIVAVQDVRGRYASDGEYASMYTAEGNEVQARDGYDAVEWAATLDGSDGRVGTWGNSYPSALAWRLAGAQPPSLAAMYTSGMCASLHRVHFGIFETGRRLQWMHAMAADARRRAGERFGPFTRADADDAWNRIERGKWIWRLPLNSIPAETFSTLAPLVERLYAESHVDVWAFDRIHSRVQVPVGVQTGWWDRFADAVNNYAGMVANGPAATRARHRLIVGPWGHSVDQMASNLGPRDYGSEGARTYVDLLTRFFDREVKGIANGLEREAPVRVFVLNDNRWRDEASWPLPGTRFTEFFLASDGRANTPGGDGALVAQPIRGAPDRYDYDPADPVMSVMSLDAQALPCDQAPLARRRDILVYQTPPLEQDMLVCGPVRCVLWASSDAPDTDFAVKLIEVGADGVAINLSYGMIRARFRNGYDRAEMMQPGTPYELDIPMMPVGIRFRRGSRIRLDIASADFPNVDRNHNTGGEDWRECELRVARQTVFHDPDHPSRLVLPLVSEAGR